MPYVNNLIFESGVMDDGIYTGVITDKIDYLDLSTKRIHLKSGTLEYHPVDDIYKEIRYIRSQDESLRVMDMPVEATGNLPKGGGKFTPRLAIFKYGWKIVPADESHTLKVTGEQISDIGEAGSQIMDLNALSPGTKVSIEYAPPEAEIITINGGSVVTEQDKLDIAAAVRTEISTELASISTIEAKVAIATAILQNKTVTDPVTGTMTVFADDNVTPLFSTQLYENIGETQPYRGKGAEVRGRLT